MRPPSLVLALSFGVALLAPQRDASADDPAAETLFRRGRGYMETSDYAKACPLFQESLRLDPAPGTLLNLADCEERTGKLASAWEHFERLAGELTPADERYEVAHARARALLPRIPHLTIRLAADVPHDARIFRDDLEMHRASLGMPLPVDPGPHVIVLIAAGHSPHRATVTAAEKGAIDLVLHPGSPTQSPPARTAGWIVGAVGVASLGTGVYFGLRALDQRSTSNAHCTGGVCTDSVSLQAYESARTDARASDIALGLGVVALAVGGFLLLASRGNGDAPRPGVHLSASGVGGVW